MSSDDPVGVVGLQIDTDETVHKTRSRSVHDYTGTRQARERMRMSWP